MNGGMEVYLIKSNHTHHYCIIVEKKKEWLANGNNIIFLKDPLKIQFGCAIFIFEIND